MPFTDPELLDPLIHCYASCPTCAKLVGIRADDDGRLDLRQRKCPHCGTFIDESDIAESFSSNFLHTQAIASANKLSSLDIAFLPFVATNLLLLFAGFPVWARVLNLLIYCVPFTLGLSWLHRYYLRYRAHDAEYNEAITSVRRFMLLWAAAHALSWSLLLI